MIRDRPAAAFEALSASALYPVVVIGLMIGTTAALVSDLTSVGIAGVLALSFLSLAYGAVRTVEEMG